MISLRTSVLSLAVSAAFILVPASPAGAQIADPGEPRITPRTENPQLLNPEQAAKAMRAAYPTLLREAGVEGVAKVWIYVDEQGRVSATELNETSGYRAMDEAAERVAGVMRFRPARDGARVVPAWVVMNIRFALTDETEEPSSKSKAAVEPSPAKQAPAPTATPQRPPRSAPTLEELMGRPATTPSDTEPRVLNAPQAVQAVEAFYPPELREAGISGTPEVWLLIDADGSVVRTTVKTTSGYADMDDAAATVGRTLRFEPARMNDQPIPVWRAMKLRFQAPTADDETADAGDIDPDAGTGVTERADSVIADTPGDAADTVTADTAGGAADTVTADTAVAVDSIPADVTDEPVAEEGETAPRLQNPDEVREAIAAAYPPVLRDTGIEGTVRLRVFVDENGDVADAEVAESSGYDAMDEAARGVTDAMRFSPAVENGTPVGAWVEFPITFETR